MRHDPYAHAPRLPEGDPVHIPALFRASSAPAFRPAPVMAEVGAGLHPAATGLELEIGPGRGWFILERLEAAPGVRLLGFEIRRKWATVVDERLARRGLAGRARVLAEDAKQALPRLPSSCLDVVYVHFPDPWWKKRHRKRLVVSDPVVSQIARVLRPGGELFIQTDVEERANAYEQVVGACPELTALGDDAGSPRVADNPYSARSPREHRAIEDGLPVHRMRWRRNT